MTTAPTIDIEVAAKTIGIPFDDWRMQCHGISLAFVIEPIAVAHLAEWTKAHAYAAQVACVLRWPDPLRWEDITGIVDRIPA